MFWTNFYFRLNKYFKNSSKPKLTLLQKYNLHRSLGSDKKFCYAPYSNLYFSFNGATGVCGANRIKIGNYLNTSIKDIWHGKEIKKIREKINHNDLSLGCHICEFYYKNQNFTSVKATTYDNLSSRRKLQYPVRMEFELDNTCNFECIMCTGEFSSAIKKNREGIENDYKVSFPKNFIDELKEFIPHLKETLFMGGEPFLITVYYEIWEQIVELNPKVTITINTNGSILNDRIKKILEEGNFQIIFSLDSIRKETLEKIRINAVHDKILSNLIYFRDYCKRKNNFFGINITVMRENWAELTELLQYANSIDCCVYFCVAIIPYTRSLIYLDTSELIEINENYNRQLMLLPSKSIVEQKNKKAFSDLINHIEGMIDTSKKRFEELQRISQKKEYRKLLEKTIVDNLTLSYFKIYKHENGVFIERKIEKITEQFKIILDKLSLNDEELVSLYSIDIRFLSFILEIENIDKTFLQINRIIGI